MGTGRSPCHDVMHRLFQILFGIKPAPWSEGGTWRVEWLALPRHDRMLMMLVGIGLSIWLVMFLYRKEGETSTSSPAPGSLRCA